MSGLGSRHHGGPVAEFVFVVTLFTITQTILSRNLSQRDTELIDSQKELSLKGVELERLSAKISRLEKLFKPRWKKHLRWMNY